ncbi:MAG: NAD-dependent epimerase/dehydratase family protein [Chitinophagaceae bacterium]
MSRILVCGGGGFIGGHLINRLKAEGHWVRSADIFYQPYNNAFPDEKITGDLKDIGFCKKICRDIDEVYQLAADMGGAGYIFTGENDADIMHNSALCNINILSTCASYNIHKIFFSSSACIYPYFNQEDPGNPDCREETAYPAMPDSEYGWEKLFSERLFLAFGKNYKMDCKIARFHNVYGPNGTWDGGKEKAPAAVCRKVAAAEDGGSIELWGDGQQTRSFLYIDDCLDGVLALMRSDFSGPVNIGSEEMVSIQQLAEMVIAISGKKITIQYIPGPTGVKGRRSDNTLARQMINWEPGISLKEGIARTYKWIENEMLLLKKIQLAS